MMMPTLIIKFGGSIDLWKDWAYLARSEENTRNRILFEYEL
jgi:hypothetical protein